MPHDYIKDQYLNDCIEQEKDRVEENYISNGVFPVLLEANLPNHKDIKILVKAEDLNSKEVLEFSLGLIEDSDDSEMIEVTIWNNLAYLAMSKANEYVEKVLEEYLDLIIDYGFESEDLEQILSTSIENLGDWIE